VFIYISKSGTSQLSSVFFSFFDEWALAASQPSARRAWTQSSLLLQEWSSLALLQQERKQLLALTLPVLLAWC